MLPKHGGSVYASPFFVCVCIRCERGRNVLSPTMHFFVLKKKLEEICNLVQRDEHSADLTGVPLKITLKCDASQAVKTHQVYICWGINAASKL